MNANLADIFNQRKVLAILVLFFFSIQIFGVIRGRFTNTKFFSWAPYDEISVYEIDVKKNGRMLNNSEIRSRYRISARGRENRSIHNIISVVRQYENRYGTGDSVRVEISYTINGHLSSTWTFPDK